METSRNKSEFLEIMIGFKEDIEKILYRRIYPEDFENIRHSSEMKLSREKFKEYLIKKVALHITFKYIFIRIASESQSLVKPKFNKEGIASWSELSKNYRKNYYMLYELACNDLRREHTTIELFKPCIYDNFTDKLEEGFFNIKRDNYIEKLKIYDFKTLDPDTAISLFDVLYPSDDREKTQEFLEESQVTTELMKSLGLL